MAAITISKPILMGLSGPLKGKKFQIKNDITSLGSSKNSDITIPGDKVSREHAVIEKDQFGVWNIIAKSDIGVLVNKNHTERASLQIGDLIQIGELTLLKFEGKPEKTSTKATKSGQTSQNKIKIKKPVLYLLLGYLMLMLGVGLYLSIDKTKEVETGLSSGYLSKVLDSTKEYLSESVSNSKDVSSSIVMDMRRDTSALFYNVKNASTKSEKNNYIDSLINQVESAFFRAWKLEQTNQYKKALDEYNTILHLIPDNNAATTKVANWRIDTLKEKTKKR